jgi:hypothetical protein
MEQYIKETFKKASTNGVLTKDKFNQTLAVLEGRKFKRLRDTPLAERLFVLFDKVAKQLYIAGSYWYNPRKRS